jgi:hypothetical protein
MIGFCPFGYVSSQEAVLPAAEFWFPERSQKENSHSVLARQANAA